MSASSRGSRRFAVAFALLASCLLGVPGALTAQGLVTTAAYVPGEVLIGFSPGASTASVQDVLLDLGATQLTDLSLIGASRQRITRYAVESAIARYRTDARIAFIEPNYIVKADRIPNDALFSQLWGMNNTGQTGGTPGADIRAVNAWDITTGESPVLVGIIDTGMDNDHPDLAANVWSNPGEIAGNGLDDDGNGFVDDVHGWNFVYHNNNPRDDNGHGTHVAGTIGATGDNGIGVAGVCWNVKLMPLKFLDSLGSGNTANAILAVEYATRMHARILNNSWGGAGYSEALRLAIRAASDAGILFVAAAGNDAADNDLIPHYPASYDIPLVISVASTDAYDQLSWFSDFGATSVDLAAPGSDILSTLPGNSYGYYSGTSMAAPHVSGALALMLSRAPAMPGAGAREILLRSVDTLSSLSGRVFTGGRLNVFHMLAEPDSTPPAAIADLQVAVVNGDWVTLTLTASGDDGTVGRASHYDLRYSTSPITPASFAAATPAVGQPYPRPAGSPDTLHVSGLVFSTPYWFAVEVLDEFGNASPVSNVAAATTLPPPVLTVTPDSLAADLFTGAQAVRMLTIGNSGPSELAFHITANEHAALAVTPRGQPIMSVGHPVPLAQLAGTGVRTQVRMDAADSPDRTAARRAGPALEPQPVHALGTEVFGSMQNGFYGSWRTRGNIFRCTTSTWLDEQRVYLEPSQATQLYFLVYEGLTQAGTYRLIGASAAPSSGPGAGWYSSGPMQVHLEAGRWYIIAASFDQACGYYAQTDVYPYPFPASFGELVAGAGWNWAPSTLFPPDSTQLVPSSAFGAAVAYYQMLVTRPGSRWLTVSSGDGTVPSGGSVDVAVTFDAGGKAGGDYRGAVQVGSNDPARPTLGVPAHLHVTGAPDIALSATSLAFGTIFTGTGRMDTLVVSNLGTDLLDVTGLAVDEAAFAVAPAGFQLAPGESRRVPVGFSPPLAGPYTGTLTLSSNDPDEGTLTVTLSGTAIDPPMIAVSPDSLVADLFTGVQTTRSLHIANTGASELAYNLSVGSVGTGGALPPMYVSRRFTSASAVTHPQLPPAGVRRYDADAQPMRGPIPAGSALPVRVDTAGTGLRILMVNCGGDDYEIRTLLAAMPDVAVVDEFDAYYAGTPSLDLLRQYNAAIVTISTGLANAVALGDVLADYVDGGGGVVMTVASFISGYNVQGRFLTGGYSPFEPGNGPVGGSSLGAYDPTHPIMQNVNTLTGDVLGQMPLAPGAQLVASYVNGLPLVATRGTHVAGVNIYVGWTGYWTGDVPTLLRNAVSWTGGANWLSVVPTQGTVPAGGGVDVTATFDATGMYGGDYVSGVRIDSNDPVRPTLGVPAHLHVTGAPDVALPATSLAFGTVFTGSTRTDTLVVRNVGTDLLDVSSLATDVASFTVQPTSFQLSPGASRAVLASFTPGTAGTYAGTLTLTSNDPDEGTLTVTLSGTAIDPPIIAVSPDSLVANLFTGGQATQTIHIANTGASELAYNLSVDFGQGFAPAQLAARAVVHSPVPPLGGLAVEPGNRWFSTTSPPPGFKGVPAPESVSVGAEVLIVEDYLPWGYPANEWILNNNGIAYDVIPSSMLAATDLTKYRLLILPSVQPTSTYQAVAAESAQIAAFVSGGGVFEFHAGGYSSGSDSWLVPLPGGMRVVPSYASDNHVLLPQHPIVAGIPVDFTGGYASHAYLTAIPGNAERIVRETADASHTNLVVYRYGAGAVVCGGQTFEIAWAYGWSQAPMLANMIPYALTLAGSGWLAASPLQGTVPAGGSVDVTITFDATGLFGGDYRAAIQVGSNDPVRPLVSVPAHLHVTGAPDITLSATSLAFGTRFTGTTRTDTLVVRNNGTDLLDVTGLATDVAAFTVMPASFQLSPGSSRTVFVRFAPAAAGPYSGTLTFTSNDPDEGTLAVTLSGTAIDPPIIAVSPDSLVANLFTGGQATQTIHIANTGASELAYNLSVDFGQGFAPALLAARAVVHSPVPPLGGLAVEPGNRWSSITSPPPGFKGVTAPESVSVGAKVLIVEDYLPWGYAVNEWILNYNGIAYDVISSSMLAATDLTKYRLLILPSVQQTSTYLAVAADSARIAAFVRGGGVFEFHAAGNNNGEWLVPLPGGMRDVFQSFVSENHVLLPQHPIVVGIPVDFTGSYASGGYFTGIPANAERIVRESADTSHTTLVVYRYGVGAVVCGSQPFEFAWANGWPQGPMLANMIPYSLTLAGSGWLVANPLQGTVPAFGSADVTMTFDATGLYGGEYRAGIQVGSNDPVRPLVNLPAHLHVTGVPDITLSATSLAFGTRFTGTTGTDTLVVRNVGTDLLDVTSLATDVAAFTVQPTSFQLSPGADRTVLVRFSPVTAGPYSGTLTVTSNDPDHGTVAVSLSGAALDPPILGVSPDSLAASLPTGGQADRTLHLANTGGSDLAFTVDATVRALSIPVYGKVELAKGESDSRPAILGGGGPDLSGYSWRDSDQPGGPKFDWVDITAAGTTLPLSGDDAIVTGVPIGFAFPFYGGTFNTVNVCTNGFLSFTSTSTQYSNTPLPSPYAPANMLAVLWDDLYVNGYSVYVRQEAERFIVSWVGVPTLGGNYVNTFQAILYPNGSFLYQYLTAPYGWDPWATAGFQNAPGSDGLTVEYNSTSYLHDRLAVEVGRTPRFLSVTPGSGTIPANGALDLVARFDATDRQAGDYRADVSIRSNDPVRPLVQVPASLHVFGVPHMALSRTTIPFGERYVGTSASESLAVRNSGTDVLEVSSLATDLSAFTVQATAFSLAPGASRFVRVTFAPNAPGPVAGVLTIISNDPDTLSRSVTLSGTGTMPPVMDVPPDSLLALLVPGQQETQTLRIANRGAGELRIRITAIPGAGLAPASAALASLRLAGAGAPGAERTSSSHALPSTQAPVTASSTPGARVLILQDVRPWLFTVIEQILQANGIAFDVIPSAQLALTNLSSYSLVIVPSVQPNSFYSTLAARSAQVDAFVSGGGVLEFHAAGLDVGSDPWLVTLPGGVAISRQSLSYSNHVLLPQHPIVAGVPVDFSGNYASNAYFTSLPADAEIVTEDPAHRRTLAVYRFGLGRVICAGQPLELAYGYGWPQGPMLPNMIPYALQLAVSWISVSPTAAVVPAGGSVDIAVSIDATGILAGDYLARVIVEGNDPVRPVVSVPVHLQVIGPVSTELSLVSATAEPGLARLAWYGGSPGQSAKVYRRTEGNDWSAIATIAVDGGGNLHFEDAGVEAGGRYGYRLGILEAGAERFFGEGWVDVPANAKFALHGLANNPVVGDIEVAFSLPDTRAATLELMDILGRRLASQEVGSLGVGRHTVALSVRARPAPGFYVVRLTRAGQTLVRGATVLR